MPKKLPKPARGMIPVLSYETPDIRDLVIYMEVQSQHANYNAPVYGSLHPGPGTKYADYELVYVSSVDENGIVKWFYAAPRIEQGAYNFQYSEPAASSSGSPSYSRTYFVPRANTGDYFDECSYVAPVTGVAATGTLTITGDVSAAAESVTVGSTTMVTTAFDAGFITNAIDMQLLGITSLTNVQMASLVADVINGDPSSVPNVNIGQPSPSTEVTAVAAAGVVTVTAIAAGVAGNSIATTENLTNGSWGAATLSGGVDAVAESGHPAGSDYLAPGSADPDLAFNPEWCGLVFTSQKITRVPDKELDSLYVLVERMFEKLCPMSGERLNNKTGLLEPYTNQVVLNADLATSGIDEDGIATTSSPINCNFSLQTTSTIRPLDTLTYNSTINYYWPPVLDYVEMISWPLLDGSARYYPRIVWKRNAYNGPTSVTVTETWSKDAPTLPDIVTLETSAALYACPLYSVNTGPCLHGDVWFQCDFGTNDPVWDFTVGSYRSTPATEYQDWPTEPFIAAATVSNVNGGYLLRELEVQAPGLAATSPPEPLVASFAVEPYAVSDTEISMTAVSGGVGAQPASYYFTETSGNPGGADSGWQTGTTYINTGLTAGTEYTYNVKARDAAFVPNVGLESSSFSATTDA